jgi:hypothetical protein
LRDARVALLSGASAVALILAIALLGVAGWLLFAAGPISAILFALALAIAVAAIFLVPALSVIAIVFAIRTMAGGSNPGFGSVVIGLGLAAVAVATYAALAPTAIEFLFPGIYWPWDGPVPGVDVPIIVG